MICSYCKDNIESIPHFTSSKTNKHTCLECGRLYFIPILSQLNNELYVYNNSNLLEELKRNEKIIKSISKTSSTSIRNNKSKQECLNIL